MNSQVSLAPSSKCTGCSACANICPTSSISMLYDEYGFLRPHLSSPTCIQCRKCEKVCPLLQQDVLFHKTLNKIYSAHIEDMEILKESTSGGIFYSIASLIIKEGGVVFGAKFDGYHVRHDFSDNLDGVHNFMGSKYVQSEIGNTYTEVKRFLQDGRIVLFTGTPCQIAGLNSFLGKSYENLLTVEILCRGVPSPLVWEKYIKEKMTELRAIKISEIRFRNKKTVYKSPIPTYVLKFSYMDKDGNVDVFYEDCLKNPYYSYFRNHVFRSSCMRCQFRNVSKSGADITIGDAIVNTIPIKETTDESTVVLHSDKAYAIWNQIKNGISYKEISFNSLESFYKGALYLQKKDRILKFVRLSNKLALKYPLKKIRHVYEFSLINHRIISVFNKFFRTSL